MSGTGYLEGAVNERNEYTADIRFITPNILIKSFNVWQKLLRSMCENKPVTEKVFWPDI
jgi:hypothetical protein